MRILRWALGVGLAVVLGLAFVFFIGPFFVYPAVEAAFRFGVRYEIPEGYTGWVTIAVNAPRCLPARVERRTFVFVADANGRGCTSTPVLEGWRDVRYVEVLRDGRRREIPTSGFGGGGRIGLTEDVLDGRGESTQFFVGTEDESQRLRSLRPRG